MEQQDRAFQASGRILAGLRRGDFDNLNSQVATVTTTLASQAELIAGLATLLRAVPEEALEKAATTVRADLESGSGDT